MCGFYSPGVCAPCLRIHFCECQCVLVLSSIILVVLSNAGFPKSPLVYVVYAPLRFVHFLLLRMSLIPTSRCRTRATFPKEVNLVEFIIQVRCYSWHLTKPWISPREAPREWQGSTKFNRHRGGIYIYSYEHNYVRFVVIGFRRMATLQRRPLKVDNSSQRGDSEIGWMS